MIKFTLYFIKTIIACIAAILFTSCTINFNGNETITPKGDVVTKTVAIEDYFDNIKISSGLNLIITQTDIVNVSVEAEENLHEYIKIYVDNETLVIKKKENFKSNSTKNIYVSVPRINKITASSASQVVATNIIKSKNLALDVSSAANIDLEIISENLELESSSAGQINIKGKAIEVKAKSSSASEINAESLLCKNASVSASSAATVKINVLNSLIANASSAADIYYVKSPVNLVSKTSSGGSIRIN